MYSLHNVQFAQCTVCTMYSLHNVQFAQSTVCTMYSLQMYSLHNVQYAQCTVFTVLSLHNVKFARCTVCTMYSLHNDLFAQWSVCTMYSLHNVQFAQCTVCTMISLHNDHYLISCAKYYLIQKARLNVFQTVSFLKCHFFIICFEINLWSWIGLRCDNVSNVSAIMKCAWVRFIRDDLLIHTILQCFYSYWFCDYWDVADQTLV